MYNIESRALKTDIGFLLSSSVDDPKKLDEEIAFYFPLVLDMIVNILNNRNTTTEEAIIDELKKYSDKPSLQLFYELLYVETRDIKKQFFMAGFDRRMRYKLTHRTLPRTNIKLHSIIMDLEGTLAHLSDQLLNDSEEEDVSDSVIDNPSIEQLDAMFDKW